VQRFSKQLFLTLQYRRSDIREGDTMASEVSWLKATFGRGINRIASSIVCSFKCRDV
jgi:hypothetical protein